MRPLRELLRPRGGDGGSLRVALCGGDAGFLAALRVALERTPRVELVAVAADALELADRALRARPAVVVLDAGAGRPSGAVTRALRRLRDADPDVRPILVCGVDAPDVREEARDAGAWELVPRATALFALDEAVLEIAAATRPPLER